MKKYFITPGSSLKKALDKVSKAESKCLLVVDKEEKLLGTLSDGDIRRAILENQDISRKISKLYNDSPFFFVEGKYSKSEARKKFTEMKYDIIPVLDEKGKVNQVFTWSSFFSSQKVKDKVTEDIPVIIMAGGKGTRLAPFTKVLPKPLIPIQDKTVIEHIISRFTSSGLENFYITVNYKSMIIKAFFSELNPSYNVDFVEEQEPLGTIGSVALVKSRINDRFFVSNCDIILDVDHADLLKFHKERGNNISIVASAKNYSIPYGTCEINEKGFLKKITEKPSFDMLINTGLYLMDKKVIQLIPPGKSFDAPDLLSQAMKEGLKIGVYPVNGDDWIDIGQWTEFREAVEKL